MNFEIYPAIDIRGGKCVRLYQGDYEQETCYYEDPLEAAENWRQAGAEWLHIVDLDGARLGEPENFDLISKIALQTGLKVQIGGGIRGLDTVQRYLFAGAERVILGSAALSSAAFVGQALERFTSEKIIVSLDAKDGKVYRDGWLEEGGEDVNEAALRLAEVGVRTFIYTNIAKDGTLEGPDASGAQELAKLTGRDIIVAGGISKAEDVLNLAMLRGSGIKGAIIGRALYTGDVLLPELFEKLGIRKGGGLI